MVGGNSTLQCARSYFLIAEDESVFLLGSVDQKSRNAPHELVHCGGWAVLPSYIRLISPKQDETSIELFCQTIYQIYADIIAFFEDYIVHTKKYLKNYSFLTICNIQYFNS